MVHGVSVTDLSTDIATAAVGPKKAQNGDQSAEARAIEELIAADKYLAAKAAVATSPRVIFNKLSPPGAV